MTGWLLIYLKRRASQPTMDMHGTTPTVGMADYRTVLSSHHCILYRQMSGNTVVYAVAADAGFFQTLLLRRLLGQ